MEDFKRLNIKNSYTGKGEKILSDFLLPVLNLSKKYDRVTSYYSVDSLIAISQGIESLYLKNGKMRLIIGIHNVPDEVINATLRKKEFIKEIDEIRKRVVEGLTSLKDEFYKNKIATLAWMLEDQLLEIKAVAVEGEGIFHPKTLIFEDENNNFIAAVGSSNETINGLGGNFEQLMVVNSWDLFDAVNDQKRFFESLWNNNSEDAIVVDITDIVENDIKKGIGESFILKKKKELRKNGFFEDASKMPMNFFVSGEIPALFQHQERAVIDALSRWPVRVLFADEVGLGKTYEIATTLAYLKKYSTLKKVVILTPKSVINQWQEELYEKFHIEAWMYDSNNNQFINPLGSAINVSGTNILSKEAPNVLLISSSFARGNDKKKHIFAHDGVEFPDLLIVDEVHSARIKINIDGSTSETLLYKMLDEVKNKIPHLIFASATPMQKDVIEYHSILKLIGLPKLLNKPVIFEKSLKIFSKTYIDLSDSLFIYKLIKSIVETYKLILFELTEKEKALIKELLDNENDEILNAELILNNWLKFRDILIKIHPAHMLTVRNTRNSLEKIGYVFPKRNLNVVEVQSDNDLTLIYERLNQYIYKDFYSVENVLNINSNSNNFGFVKSSYHQRVVSSLYSCYKSLDNRFMKLLGFKKYLLENDIINNEYSINNDIYGIDADFKIQEYVSEYNKNEKNIDVNLLIKSLESEITCLYPLKQQIKNHINEYGDLKIKQSIILAINSVKDKDKVLLFSRYTDTVFALIEEFNEIESTINYGIYTGNETAIVLDGKKMNRSKEEIKEALNNGLIKILFCSDAASEGINLQSARVLINVDIPWTPARLEQRIGRIARLGQKANEVDIYNVWYPLSIEAKMYNRIQSRLDSTNIAIGEFPDVIAEEIIDSIIYNKKDSSAETINKLRNSIKLLSLEKLWSKEYISKSKSKVFREKLLVYCKDISKKSKYNTNSECWEFVFADGNKIYVTSSEGNDRTISLKTIIENNCDVEVNNIDTLNMDGGQKIAFITENNKCNYVVYECIPNIVIDCNIKTTDVTNVPSLVPSFNKMNLGNFVDVYFPDYPKLWN